MNTIDTICAELKAIATPLYNDSYGDYFPNIVKDAFYRYNDQLSKRELTVAVNDVFWRTTVNTNVLLTALDGFIIESIGWVII